MKLNINISKDNFAPATAKASKEDWLRSYSGKVSLTIGDVVVYMGHDEARALADSLMQAMYASIAIDNAEAAAAAAALKRERDAEAEANA